jgi:hypothetical protein
MLGIPNLPPLLESKSSGAPSQANQVAESMGFKGEFRQWKH